MGLRTRIKRRLSALLSRTTPAQTPDTPPPQAAPAPSSKEELNSSPVSDDTQSEAPTTTVADTPLPPIEIQEPEPSPSPMETQEPERPSTLGTVAVTLQNPLNDSITVLNVLPGEFILDAADRLGEDLPHSCRSGGCLSCAAKLLDGEAEIAEEQFVLEDSDISLGYRLLCCTTVSGPATFLTHQVDEI